MCPQPDHLYRYLPHRPPMLLLDRLLDVQSTCSEAAIQITSDSTFYIPHKGVPAWIGIEYMGQTAAAIAGYQLEAGTLAPHVGLLLGTRKYRAAIEWFAPGTDLRVRCNERGVMPGGIATFQCEIALIEASQSESVVATANLTVYRTTMKPESG
ncbi:MAG: hypothetical protein KTR18_01245 [Acidiferrobacterales bacterium]|nr:hypothetical protein [Acidiferrobacterales bacterium]